MIWVPKKELILPMRVMPKFQGWFKLDVIKPDGRVRHSTGWFPNLITNAGMDMLGAQNTWNDVVAVGSGNTTPAFTDTALASLVASTTSQFSYASGVNSTTPYYGFCTKTWQFAQGAAAGNLAEVGVGTASTSLFSRALILDGGGSPTTITVLANEFLNVTYETRQYAPTTDVTGSVVLSGITYNYTIRSSQVTTVGAWQLQGNNDTLGQRNQSPELAGATFSGAGVIAFPGASTIGSITSLPSGTGTTTGTAANSGYSAASYNRDSNFTWDVTQGNLTGGIGALQVHMGTCFQQGDGTFAGGRGTWQIGFSPAIPKDNTKQLTLNFNLAWTRGP